ncbi:NAD(P)-dependent oxidoreductase [Lutibacter sp.]|uniref:NAD-dependent epimerase/dehydratase family protein n=1 Tax=Lutibacter sp. TaxID=1925666 RepID=UPI00273609B6|nr:NAD-dependent epimerase/dehydratase family protein [Lutibacter sp.]MDP3312573.1 SDR family oxidoreductase [Lutibacter sp.]
MILFTGSGAIAESFSEIFPCEIISARNLNDKDLTSYIMKADVIIHNAAIINAKSFRSYIDGNFMLTKRIIDLIYKVKPLIKFINISSMSILLNNDEYLQADKMTEYAFSKFISEIYCLKHPLERLTNVRFSTIFYGNEKRDGISKLIYDSFKNNEINIYNEGSALRDIIPIKILCQYLYKLSKVQNFEKKINIVSGKPISFRRIVEILKNKNDKLIINDIVYNPSSVLANFSKKDILNIGEIGFDIEDEVLNFYNKLNENFNL